MIRLLPIAALIAAAPALAVPTPVTVRVLSQGAKFIGTGMGGVEVELTDAATGASLAKGRIEGGTGDTAKIMPGAPRGTAMADDKTAKFDAVMDIGEPLEVRVTVKGPLRGQAVSATTTRWLLPGQPVVGDGWVLELQGLALDARQVDWQIVADVSMLCGCPIAPDTLWKSDRFKLVAIVDGKPMPMTYAGKTGRYTASSTGKLIWVTALDTLTGATAATKVTVRVHNQYR